MENLNTQVILEVVKSGSFKRAADSLGYTQAGVAYIINAAEKAWNIKLFVREYGGVRLTEEGKILLPYIQQIDKLHRQMLQKVNEINHLEAGQIRIVSFEVAYIHWLPEIVASFKADYPKIDFEFITCEDRNEAARKIYDGDADIGFFILPVSKPIDTIPLLEEPMMAIVSPDHPLANAECFPVSEIPNYPYISMKEDENSELADIFDALGIHPKPAFTLESDYADMAFVSKNLGYAIFSRTAALGAPFNLRALPFDREINRTICLAVKSESACSEIVRKFISYTRKYMSTL